MKRYIPLLLIITLVVSPIYAESTWEGTSAVSRYGEFPESGNYGASNSFAKNTIVTIKNLENGQETTVIIVDRLDDPGVFLLVSRDAAKELGIAQGEIGRVRAAISQPERGSRAFPDDLPYNPDPDVNPAASASAYLDEVGDYTDVADTTEAADTIDTVDTTESTESTETTDTTEVADATDPVDTTEAVDTADTTESTETSDTTVEDTTPRVNGVDTPETPLEEETPDTVADEPTPPLDTGDTVAVTSLADVDDDPDVDPRLQVETPPDPEIEDDSAPTVLGILPPPVLDQPEAFVLLAEPDEPAVGEIVETDTEETEELRVSALGETTPPLDDRLDPVVPPEPVYMERIVEPDSPEAEDILFVMVLDEPRIGEPDGFAMPDISDEPAVVYIEEEKLLSVSSLLSAEAAEEEGDIEVADIPEIFDTENTFDETGARVSLLNTPADSDDEVVDVAGITPKDEPPVEDARMTLLDSAEGELDEAIGVLDLNEPDFALAEGDPGLEAADDTPVVVNGFKPPTGDTEEIGFVFEPAEPRPPEARIAGADLLDSADGDEPETDVDVAVLTEPVIPVEETAKVVEATDITPVDSDGVTKTTTEDEGSDTAVAAVDTTRPVSGIPDYTTELARESFYLQLGVFAEPGSAQQLQDNLAETYPVTVYLSESSDRRIYKVLVGPLNQDESGALLYQFRTKGYPDAFVRKGTVN